MKGYGPRLTLDQRERYCGPDGLGIQDREQVELQVPSWQLLSPHLLALL